MYCSSSVPMLFYNSSWRPPKHPQAPLLPSLSLLPFISPNSIPNFGTLKETPPPEKKMPLTSLPTFFFLLLLLHCIPYSLSSPQNPHPDPASIQPFLPTPSPPTSSSSTPTISAFPEQSNLATCPLDLSEDLFHGISNACNRGKDLTRSKCCPVLAAWLYSAYASTALGRIGRNFSGSTPYDILPVLPEDSESCVENLEKGLRGKGMELRKPNETCDVVYCYCNIRLHPLSCNEAFRVTKEGKLVGDENVMMLEKDCQGHLSLPGCSKCLNRLYQLKEGKNVNRTKKSDRKSKIHNRDCELMGLTWLLSKNRTTYIHTVSAVLRALMMSPDGSDPQSCSLASDGMPLAVDSAEFDDNSAVNRDFVSLIYLIVTTTVFTLFFIN